MGGGLIERGRHAISSRMSLPNHFELLATDGAARTGRLTTPHGMVRTPAFMPVGTAGAMKGMHWREVREAGADSAGHADNRYNGIVTHFGSPCFMRAIKKPRTFSGGASGEDMRP